MKFVDAVESARKYQREKKFSKSLRIWENLLTSNPDKLVARLGAGNDSLILGLLDNAECHFQSAQKINPEHVGAYVGTARVAQNRRDYHRAVEFWEDARKLQPGRPDLAVRLLQCLILGKHPDYKSSIEKHELEIDQFDRACVIVANALASIHDTKSECEFLSRICTSKSLSDTRLRLIGRLIRSLLVEENVEKISNVLDTVYCNYGTRLIYQICEDSFAQSLAPQVAHWLCRNEEMILKDQTDNDIAAQVLLARAYLWIGERGTAVMRFTGARERLLAECTDECLDIPTWVLLAESCMETGDFNSARSAVYRLAQLSLKENNSKAVKYLRPFSTIVSANGYETVRQTVAVLVKNYLKEENKDLPYGFLLARLCIESNLEAEADRLFYRLKPDPDHWLRTWCSRNQPGQSDKRKSPYLES